MTKDEALKQALSDAKRKERHFTVAETRYWLEQYKLIAEQALNDASHLAAPVQEPVGWWDAKLGFFEEKHFDQLQPVYTTPPAASEHPDWKAEYQKAVELHCITLDELREADAWIKNLEKLMAIQDSLLSLVVPDKLTRTDGETPEYMNGWNDCRELMLKEKNK